jgi:hypothetical protein
VTLPACRVGRWLAGVLLVALALTGCERSRTPEQQLRDAARATFTEDVAFTLTTIDDGDLPDAAAPGGRVVAFLSAFEFTGIRRADGGYAVAVEIGGTAPLLEVRGRGGDGEVLLRTGLGELLGVEGDPAAAFAGPLDGLDLDDRQRAALLAGFEGEWIAIPDAGGLGALSSATLDADADGDADGDASEVADPFDLRRLMDALDVVGGREEVAGGREVAVRLETVAWLGPRAVDDDGLGLPATVPGQVVIREGRIHEVTLELGNDEGTTDRHGLRLLLTDHGQVEPLAPAEPVATVSRADLAELVRLLDAGPG